MISADALVDKFKYALDDGWGYIFGQSGTEWTKSDQNQKVKYMESTYGSDWKKDADAKNSKYYRSALLGGKWIGHRVADCSGLFVWAYRQFGEKIAHVSTTIYTSYCGKKGRLTDDLKKSISPGTAVFTGDLETNHPHVGLYVGNGKVIEAAGVDAGVCTSNLSAGKWKWYGELKAVTYPDNDSGFPENPGWRPTIRRGSKGTEVKECQAMLDKLGYDLGPCGVDGDFGRQTEKAVKEFQRDNRLGQDGVVGPLTWDALDKAVSTLKDQPKVKTYSVTVKGLTKEEAEALMMDYKDSVLTEE